MKQKLNNKELSAWFREYSELIDRLFYKDWDRNLNKLKGVPYTKRINKE